MATPAENFHRNFRRLRKNHEPFLSQRAIADQVGVSQNYIGMLERGERNPTLDTLNDLAEVLGIEPYKLLMSPEALAED